MFETVRKNYSSDVAIEVTIGERRIPVERTGPGYVVFLHGTDLSPGTEGELRMTIDERSHRRLITFPQGAVPFDRKAQVRDSKAY